MRLLLLAAAVMFAIVAPAGAEVSDTGVFGYWTTFAGVATDGNPVCGMKTDWGARGQTNALFLIKYFGRDGIVIHIGRGGWQVPSGQPARVRIQVDQAPIMEVLSHGIMDETQGFSLLELVIKGDDVWKATGKNAIREFFALLATGRRITISFPDGSEHPWVGQLDGSRTALQSFSACATTIDAAIGGARSTTQPFSPEEPPKPATTQPFHQL